MSKDDLVTLVNALAATGVSRVVYNGPDASFTVEFPSVRLPPAPKTTPSGAPMPEGEGVDRDEMMRELARSMSGLDAPDPVLP